MLNHYGIRHEYAPVGSAQHDGVVKSRIGMTLELAMALRLEAPGLIRESRMPPAQPVRTTAAATTVITAAAATAATVAAVTTIAAVTIAVATTIFVAATATVIVTAAAVAAVAAAAVTAATAFAACCPGDGKLQPGPGGWRYSEGPDQGGDCAAQRGYGEWVAVVDGITGGYRSYTFPPSPAA